MFLRHEGFLGAIGAWLRNIEPAEDAQQEMHSHHDAYRDGNVKIPTT